MRTNVGTIIVDEFEEIECPYWCLVEGITSGLWMGGLMYSAIIGGALVQKGTERSGL